MAKVTFLEELCKGCLLCSVVCPKQIIRQTDRFNSQGYKVVELSDPSLCLGCGFCSLMCPDSAIVVSKEIKEAQDG